LSQVETLDPSCWNVSNGLFSASKSLVDPQNFSGR